MDKDTQFDILYFDDCPSWQTAAGLLEEVIEMLDLAAGIDLLRVETDEEAQEQRFVGSPSIRLDGKDLFPVDHENYALGCRVYQTPEGMRGWPTEEMLIASLHERFGE
ncbi:MAG: hypothetical protein P1P76_11650 [Anaerolineales bacterium]|nr:hypothetical protein [Anaerolineales bacterium]